MKIPLALLLLLTGCFDGTNQSVRNLSPAETTPHETAPGAKSRWIGGVPDGVQNWVVVLSPGDEVLSAMSEFAKAQKVSNAHFVGIGGVKDPEVAWYDLDTKKYKAMKRAEQMEVLTMSGDIVGGENGPVVHAHMILGDASGNAWGGHLIRATASPLLEIYVTIFPTPIVKKPDPATGLQRMDLQ